MFSLTSSPPCTSHHNRSAEYLSDIFKFTSSAASCMDSNPARWNYLARWQRRQHTPRSDSRLDGRVQQQYSSPLPQTEWPGYDVPSRAPAGSRTPRPSSSQGLNTAPTSFRHSSPPISPINDSWGRQDRAADSQRRRRAHDRDVSAWERPALRNQTTPTPVDHALLYPQMAPYSDRLSMHSAPDDLEFYQTHPQESSSKDADYIPTLSNSTSVPRKSTYPPRSSMRRTHTTAAAAIASRDVTFADEAEVNLFAQATTGLGMDEPFSSPFTPASSFSSQQPQRQQYLAPPPSTLIPPRRPVSANHPRAPQQQQEADAPIIAQAIQQLEALLADSPASGSPSSNAAQQRRSFSLSQMDMHPQALRAAATFLPHGALDEPVFSPPGEEGEEDFDDELPDYEASQAQAQAQARFEAARRAQELQRRWQLGGSRRPL